jgi:hypothetical protein
MGKDVMGNDGSHHVPAKGDHRHSPDVVQRKSDAEKINDRLCPSNEHHASAKTQTHPTRTHHAVHHSGSQGHHGGGRDDGR